MPDMNLILEHTKLTYKDCLQDKARVPHDPVRLFMFQVLMVGCMVAVMATFNGVRQSGMLYFSYMHWFYPILLCISLFVRRTFANPVTDFLITRFVKPHGKSYGTAFAKTCINTFCMSPIVSLFVSLLLVGADFGPHYLATMPLSLMLSVLVSHFVVGPAVKLFYHYVIHPRSVVPILDMMGKASCALTRAMGC